jgi:hypothetical protein
MAHGGRYPHREWVSATVRKRMISGRGAKDRDSSRFDPKADINSHPRKLHTK